MVIVICYAATNDDDDDDDDNWMRIIKERKIERRSVNEWKKYDLTHN